mmetsp:Transcript_93191/g.263439  ORF Transcript_93191/g.263439 Transcript_93191/m.263439 type:complete len:209 (+) Transcript_93191:1196-1822(+)
MCSVWRTLTRPTLRMSRRFTRLPSTSLSGIGSSMSWTPCFGRPIGKRTFQMRSSTSDGASSSTSTTTVGPPLFWHGAMRSSVTACRTSFPIGSGSTYRNFSGHTRCSPSCVAQTTNTLQARTTSFGRHQVQQVGRQPVLPLPLVATPTPQPARPNRLEEVQLGHLHMSSRVFAGWTGSVFWADPSTRSFEGVAGPASRSALCVMDTMT